MAHFWRGQTAQEGRGVELLEMRCAAGAAAGGGLRQQTVEPGGCVLQEHIH